MTKRNYKENKCGIATVRFNAEELKRINKACEVRERTVSYLLKESFFTKSYGMVAISKEDFDEIYKKELSPMLNNLRQITNAYRKNFAYGMGHFSENRLNEIIEKFCEIFNFLSMSHMKPLTPWKV